MAEEPEIEGPPPEAIVRTVVAALLFAHWCGPDRNAQIAKELAEKAFDRADNFLEILSKKEPDLKAALL